MVKIALAILFILMVLALLSLIGLSAYIFHTINMVAIYVIVVTGLNILMGFTGQISIGHAAFFGIGAYMSAIVAQKIHPFNNFWKSDFTQAIQGHTGLFLFPVFRRVKDF